MVAPTKAQMQLNLTLDKLTELGFDQNQTLKLMKGANKGGSNQKSLLINIQKLIYSNFNLDEVSVS